MRNAGLDEAQTGLELKNVQFVGGRNINHLRYADNTILMAKSEGELKSFSMKVKEESEKVDWKLNTEKSYIMVSAPITSWQIDGQTVGEWQTLSFWAPKCLQVVTAAMKSKDACSLEEKLWQTYTAS